MSNEWDEIRAEAQEVAQALFPESMDNEEPDRPKITQEEMDRKVREAKRSSDDVEALERDLEKIVLLDGEECKCTFRRLCHKHFPLLGGHALNHKNAKQFLDSVTRIVPKSQLALTAVPFFALGMDHLASDILECVDTDVLVPHVSLQKIVVQLCLSGRPQHAMRLSNTLSFMFKLHPEKKRMDHSSFLEKSFPDKRCLLDVMWDTRLASFFDLSWYKQMRRESVRVLVGSFHPKYKSVWRNVRDLWTEQTAGTDVMHEFGKVAANWFEWCPDDKVITTIIETGAMSKVHYFALVHAATKKRLLGRVIKLFGEAVLRRKYIHPLVASVVSKFYNIEGQHRFQAKNIDEEYIGRYAEYWIAVAEANVYGDHTNFYPNISYCKPFLSYAAMISGTPWPNNLGERPPGMPIDLLAVSLDWCAEDPDTIEELQENKKRMRNHAIVQDVAKKIKNVKFVPYQSVHAWRRHARAPFLFSHTMSREEREYIPLYRQAYKELEKMKLTAGDECTCTFVDLCPKHESVDKTAFSEYATYSFMRAVDDTLLEWEIVIMSMPFFAMGLNSLAAKMLEDLSTVARVPEKASFEHIAVHLCLLGFGGHCARFSENIDTLFKWHKEKRTDYDLEFFTRKVFKYEKCMLDVITIRETSSLRGYKWFKCMFEKAMPYMLAIGENKKLTVAYRSGHA